MTVRGRNLVTGLPEAVDMSSIEIREALANSVNTIVETVRVHAGRYAARIDRRPDGDRRCLGWRRRVNCRAWRSG